MEIYMSGEKVEKVEKVWNISTVFRRGTLHYT